MPAGKPSFAKFGPEKRTEYLAALEEGQWRATAAKGVGVSRELVRLYRAEHPEFRVEEQEAERLSNEQVVNALFQAAISGNTTACQVWLYNRMPETWADRRNVQHTGAEGGPIEIVNMTDDERAELMRETRDELDRRLHLVKNPEVKPKRAPRKKATLKSESTKAV